MIETIAFYTAAFFMILSSAGVICARNPVRAAMFLILAFFSASSLWILLQAEFLAILLVLVYVGAVMVLFVYVIMMVNIDPSPLVQKIKAESSLLWFVGVAIFSQIVLIFSERFLIPAQMLVAPKKEASYSNTTEIGMSLFTDYLYVFELAGMMLLLAIVSAIVLVGKERQTSKFQEASSQSKVSKHDRLKIVKVPAQKQAQNPNTEAE